MRRTALLLGFLGWVSLGQAAETQSYIVRMAEPGVLYYEGKVEGIAPTALRATGERKLNVRSDAAIAYRAHLAAAIDGTIVEAKKVLGREIATPHRYDITMSGFSAELTDGEADKLRQLPGVSSVEVAPTYELSTDSGPTLINAPLVWNGSAMPNNAPNRGENIVVGILDGGANSAHPSFGNDPSCGFSVALPKQISAVDCGASSGSTCTGATPEDTTNIGHGVHTSSTAVGVRLVPPLTYLGVPLRWEISGVAPCSRLRHYKVCTSASCQGAAILAAIQATIADGIDVMNFSISGGNSPWSDNDRGFLDMVNADIFVAASAGNTSATIPTPLGNVNHRGPWVMTVANSTHDRIEGFPLSVQGGPQNVASQASATPIPATVTASVAVGAALGSEQGCGATSPYAAGSMAGRIALIQRGSCNFTEKALNAQSAGATHILVYNNVGGPPVSMPALAIPGAMISNTSGNAIRDFLIANPASQMTITAPAVRVTDPAFADVLNGGSLTGPNNSFDVTKPDITGPGTNIYAAVSPNAGQFGFLTGTSMSSPHVAGAGALVRSAHPGWTPQEVKSALQMTAKRDGLNAAASATWHADEVGNGRVDVAAAVRSGLVMNETFSNFLAANPGSGGQPRNLNLPSLRHTTCNGSCTFTRTFRNAQGLAGTWNAIVSDAPAGTQITVTPSSFTFGASSSETATVTIQVAVTAPAGITTTAFGHLIFRAAGQPDARLSVAIRGTSDALFANGFE